MPKILTSNPLTRYQKLSQLLLKRLKKSLHWNPRNEWNLAEFELSVLLEWHVWPVGSEDTGFDLTRWPVWSEASRWSWSRTERPASNHKCRNPLSRLGFAISVVWNLKKVVLTRLAKKVRFPVLSQERQSWLLAKEVLKWIWNLSD